MLIAHIVVGNSAFQKTDIFIDYYWKGLVVMTHYAVVFLEEAL